MCHCETKVGDVVKRIPSSACGMYVTCEGRVIRRDDEMKTCGIRDGSTVQLMCRMRSRGRHIDKTNTAEKKQAVSPKRSASKPKCDEGPAIQECYKDNSIQQLEEK